MHSKTLLAVLLVLPLGAAAQAPQFVNPPGLSKPAGYTHDDLLLEVDATAVIR